MTREQRQEIQIGMLEAALADLLEWGRTYTSPKDANSPHQLLVNAHAALETVREQRKNEMGGLIP